MEPGWVIEKKLTIFFETATSTLRKKIILLYVLIIQFIKL